jgi:phenylacetic acid degradation protein
MAKIYSFEGITPVVHGSAYVHPQAVLIGDVWIGARCYVGPGAVLRADFGRIELREGANIQDNCVAHSLPDFDCVMDQDSHIGHGAVIHSCFIGRNSLVGMNAVVMDYAKVEEEAIVAAMSFVKIGGVVARRTLVAGVPAKLIRSLSDADIEAKSHGTGLYHELAQRCLTGLQPAIALAQADTGRARTNWQF